MIVRMWHGRVKTEKAAAYRAFLNERAIPDYRSVAGNISVHILERQEGEITHFITMTFWESMEAIRGFAGEEVGKPNITRKIKTFCWSSSRGWCITKWLGIPDLSEVMYVSRKVFQVCLRGTIGLPGTPIYPGQPTQAGCHRSHCRAGSVER